MRGVRAGTYYFVMLVCAIALAGCATHPGVNRSEAADANASLGAEFLRKNDTDRAQTYFHKALSYDADDFSANWGMAVVNQRLGHTAKARHYYQKTLRLRSSPKVFNSYAVFLCQQGDVDRAVGYFQRAAADPHYQGKADALANAGLCLERAGRDADARAYYGRALQVDASQSTALVHMARLEYARGRYLKARAFIERADSAIDLGAEQLLLGARIELALNDRQAAESYLKRHNTSRPGAAMSMSELEQSRS